MTGDFVALPGTDPAVKTEPRLRRKPFRQKPVMAGVRAIAAHFPKNIHTGYPQPLLFQPGKREVA